jgi:cysteinyl-tRNA synthetase
LFELLKRLNKQMDSAPFSQTDAQLALDLFWRADRIFCVLDFGQEALVEDHISLLIEERSEARASGNFERADALREELEAQGVALDDTPSGSRVRPQE